ncbi:RNA-binding protein NOB1 [Onthophagus taurus]|uniref:RNA-binding protein NOB1 n=1 Tax=Onthophagus taurus TaxID=166361 RepID=UPI0039BDE4FC
MHKQKIDHLVVDTSAFIQNAPLQEIAENFYTIQEVVDEITNKRQLRRLCVLPYDLKIKHVFPENIVAVTEFSKKTGDYKSLSATDIKVMALTLQLEKEYEGVEHVRYDPVYQKSVNYIKTKVKGEVADNLPGFYYPKQKSKHLVENENDELNDENVQDNNKIKTDDLMKNLHEKFGNIDLETVDQIYDTLNEEDDDVLTPAVENEPEIQDFDKNLEENDWITVSKNRKPKKELYITPIQDEPNSVDEEDTDSGSEYDDDNWITPENVKNAILQTMGLMGQDVEDKPVKVACMTKDFAMQNVLKQMNLNVSILNGQIIKQLRTYIFRCYSCYKTTSIMTNVFCPKCGYATLKRVCVSVDDEGKQIIHINMRKPISKRGKKFSLPTPQGGKHANNPILSADQPVPDQRPSRLARTKTNVLADDYITGYSPFVTRDVQSRSALLGIKNKPQQIKHWMRKNPNEARKKRK